MNKDAGKESSPATQAAAEYIRANRESYSRAQLDAELTRAGYLSATRNQAWATVDAAQRWPPLRWLVAIASGVGWIAWQLFGRLALFWIGAFGGALGVIALIVAPFSLAGMAAWLVNAALPSDTGNSLSGVAATLVFAVAVVVEWRGVKWILRRMPKDGEDGKPPVDLLGKPEDYPS